LQFFQVQTVLGLCCLTSAALLRAGGRLRQQLPSRVMCPPPKTSSEGWHSPFHLGPEHDLSGCDPKPSEARCRAVPSQEAPRTAPNRFVQGVMCTYQIILVSNSVG
jgi:hypothetical protein